ncbi:hypothetical protein [Thermococcus stetteri]|uniref:hypothetical protein n=1 Tax=Thermococcus stetteri TaxID=49900 RepID=UPI001FD7C958|nr:hypothetical protein [Thermococcus stetteri]MBP1912594.1 hypothetical protein [Thermococcus stetteri]
MGEVEFDGAGEEVCDIGRAGEDVVLGIGREEDETEVTLVFSPAGAFERQADANTMRSERNSTPASRIEVVGRKAF